MTTLSEVLATDLEWKGPGFAEESEKLAALYQSQGRSILLAHLKSLGQGDPEQRIPLMSKILQRMIHSAAVTWDKPPIRKLRTRGQDRRWTFLDDQSPESELVADLYLRARVNTTLKSADRWRTLLGQEVIYGAAPKGAPQLRLLEPHYVHRAPDPYDASNIHSDRAVAIRERTADESKDKRYQLWVQVEEGRWRGTRVNGDGDELDLLYPGEPEGIIDWCPFAILYDEEPEGRAWLPIDETRTAFALAHATLMLDTHYLHKMEAHTPTAVSGVDSDEVPKSAGPGQLWQFRNADARVQAFATNPKLAESVQLLRHLMEVFAVGEGFPADYFLPSRQYETGAAGRLRMQDLERRRQDQAGAARQTEAEVFDILRGLSGISEEEAIGEGLSLHLELSRNRFPMGIEELQKAYAFDLSIGAASLVDYYQAEHEVEREEAILALGRIQEDRERYPVRENPSAILDGPRAALGEGSATPIEPDSSSMNPNRAASVEGGSRIDAARRGLGM